MCFYFSILVSNHINILVLSIICAPSSNCLNQKSFMGFKFMNRLNAIEMNPNLDSSVATC
uniref:Uncharacterized protein n=1 Tax=Setaria viridis TaxID=4556 RepID=A0A4U6VGR1_SETVI|nr:hypothetical protein SEVIR_3G293401v2 [Setaria viridis]